MGFGRDTPTVKQTNSVECDVHRKRVFNCCMYRGLCEQSCDIKLIPFSGCCICCSIESRELLDLVRKQRGIG